MVRLISCGKGEIEQAVHASLYLDCRIMWNPYRDPILGGKTGDSPEVQDWIARENSAVVSMFLSLIKQGLATRETRNSGRDPSKPFIVACFCLAGVHRSRGMKHVLAKALRSEGIEVEVA